MLHWYPANQTTEFAVPTGPSDAMGLVFDGANVWVVNVGTNQVTKLRASDGTNLGSFRVGNDPDAVAFDGSAIWVTNRVDNTVTKLQASNGVRLGTFAVGQHPWGIAFDGANIWVANEGSGVTKLRASEGFSNAGVAFDGANIWVANQDMGTITKLRASDGTNLGTFPLFFFCGGGFGSTPTAIVFDGANIWADDTCTPGLAKF